MNGDITVLRDGTLLYAFCDLPDKPSGIYACMSRDLGETWSEPRLLLPFQDSRFSSADGESLAHPRFLRRNNGQLMMAYIWSVGGHDHSRLFLRGMYPYPSDIVDAIFFTPEGDQHISIR